MNRDEVQLHKEFLAALKQYQRDLDKMYKIDGKHSLTGFVCIGDTKLLEDLSDSLSTVLVTVDNLWLDASDMESDWETSLLESLTEVSELGPEFLKFVKDSLENRDDRPGDELENYDEKHGK